MGKKILFLSNHFITLYNFRKELIKKLIEDGNEIYLSMPRSDDNSFFSNMGCKIIETPVDRRGVNPVRDFRLIIRYIKIMRRLKPDIIFSFTIKPNIYGSIASKITHSLQISNITGTGSTFMQKGVVNTIAKILYRLSIKYSFMVFFQNNGDKDFFVKNKLIKNNFKVIPGSGVNIDEFALCDLPPYNQINFIFVGRIMKIKGIDEYLECAATIKQRYPNTNFFVAGFIEEEKYQKIIQDKHDKGNIIYLGFKKSIQSWIKKIHCLILPSHGGEGIPNVLLECMAMGRFCIASNISGCNEVIDNEVNGYLYKVGDTHDLICKVESFIKLDAKVKKCFGLNGRLGPC